MTIRIPPGVFDLLPNDPKEQWRNIHLWHHVESVIRDITTAYGFSEIRPPIFERTELFHKSTGKTTDIVTKEMYTFEDRGGRSMTLRPEGTPSVMRALIEKNLHSYSSVLKFFYIAPMFRYERQQAGRYRQHHQFGVEVVGSRAPEQDVEVIDLLYSFYQRLGLQGLEVCINSLGDHACRKSFRDALLDYLTPYRKDLSEDSQKRLETNPLRILDSKNPNDQKLLEQAPSILDFLNDESRAHFENIQKRLDQLEIPYKISPRLVRGLDYYTDTVFEVIAPQLGSQNSIGGGGRYDGLVQSLGGPDLPAIGFGTGIERIIQTMLAQGVDCPESPKPLLFLIPLGDQAKERCFKILHELRKSKLPCLMDYSGKKLGKVMQQANALEAKYTVVVGDQELESDQVEVKEMESGDTTKVSLSELEQFIIGKRMQQMWQKMFSGENPLGSLMGSLQEKFSGLFGSNQSEKG